MAPLLKVVQDPSNGTLSFCLVNCIIQFGLISKCAEGTLKPMVYVADKDVEEHWPQDGPLGEIIYDQLPLRHRG